MKEQITEIDCILEYQKLSELEKVAFFSRLTVQEKPTLKRIYEAMCGWGCTE